MLACAKFLCKTSNRVEEFLIRLARMGWGAGGIGKADELFAAGLTGGVWRTDIHYDVRVAWLFTPVRCSPN